MEYELNHLQQPVGIIVPDWRSPPHPQLEPMQGHFCRLEPLDAERHSRSLFAANALDVEGRNWTYLPYGPFDTFDSYHAWIIQQCEGNDPLFYAIIDQATNLVVGVASYLRIMPGSASIEVGHLNFSPLLQGTRAATEVIYLMMARAFALGYRRYEWKCDALNAPSRVAAQRLGLSFEGVFRQAAVIKGHNRDTAWYAAIDQEWPAIQAVFLLWLAPANFDPFGKQRTRLSDLTAPILKLRG